jgi:hypothetical protein
MIWQWNVDQRTVHWAVVFGNGLEFYCAQLQACDVLLLLLL